ncbi:carbohydrate ABC transporter permease [Leeia aquatica]|uniref:Sugar ABC transporter permease n=1 Tax=Leeia aquatica TaxID=2725557 RepID=A0A847RXD7_9NEIS|nr:sugar ABC transporter permease [Leeia aquatica]NLR74411.1 sugar ABC transporter permease [Leeia aquatica]
MSPPLSGEVEARPLTDAPNPSAWKHQLEKWLPQIAISPALTLCIIFFYGLAVWVGMISFTDSAGMPSYNWVGFDKYVALWNDDYWWEAVKHLLVFAPLAVGLPLLLGAILAIFLDQKIRFEGGFRTIYLYPLALSSVVTGTIWRWMLAPDTGIEAWLHSIGMQNASFAWLVESDKVLFALAIVAIWQSTGFVMAMFVAGLRGIDDSIFKAAMLDGASLPRVYWRIILPILRPTLFSALLLLLPAALKSAELVIVMTQGGPGQSSTLPAYYMYDRFFTRAQMGLGSASGMIIMMMCISIAVPYVMMELKRSRHE